MDGATRKNGWRFGEKRDNERKIDPLMVPFGNLPKEEKEKDRRAVRDYPEQVRSAGLEIVWLQPHAAAKDPKRKNQTSRGKRKTRGSKPSRVRSRG